MKTLNTLKGYHFWIRNSVMRLDKKEYIWHIPKVLRKDNIQKGDIVLVKTSKGRKKVIVSQVYREEFEIEQKKYKPVLRKLNYNQQKQKSESDIKSQSI